MRVFRALSARNRLRGRIKDVKLGDVMAHVVVAVVLVLGFDAIAVYPGKWRRNASAFLYPLSCLKGIMTASCLML
jgi:hypothetical protein